MERQDSFSIPQMIRSNLETENDQKTMDGSRRSLIIGQNKPPGSSQPFTHKLNNRIPLFGLLMSLLSVICFSLASLIVKILTDFHALEILAIRSIFQTICFLAITLYLRLPIFGQPGHRLDIFLRAVFGSIAALTIYMSYRLIPLADASTIQFSAPVLVFILAYFILGEKLTIFHILIGLLAFIGVVFVSKPKFILQYFDPSILDKVNYTGIILAIVAAISTAFAMIMLRKLKQTPVHIVVLWFSITTVISAFIALYFIDRFIWPNDWTSWCWLVGIGLCGIGDQLFMTLAFKYESAGIVSVSRTLTIVLAFIWDTLLLDVIVHWTSILGSILVIIAVILLAIVKSVENDSGVFHRLWSKVCCCCGGGRGYVSDDSDCAEGEREKLLMSGKFP